jgi:hypothetical protein
MVSGIFTRGKMSVVVPGFRPAGTGHAQLLRQAASRQ